MQLRIARPTRRWRALLIIGALGSGAFPPPSLAGQDRPVTLSTTGDRSPDDLTGENRYPLSVTGFGVGDYSFDHRTGDNTARAGKMAVAFFRELSRRVWFFGQLTTALAAGDGGSDADGEVATEIEIDNLLVNFTPGEGSPLSVAFGRFDVPVGFERDDEPLNFQATTSFNFEVGRPAKMVGLIGRWVVSPSLEVTGIAGNGWDAQVDRNQGKTVGLRLGLLPTDRTSFGLSGLIGNEGEPEAVHERYLLSADYALEPGNGWILAGEANLGGDHGALEDGSDARWYGATLTVFRRMSEHFGATVRGETFRDDDGARTGRIQTLRSLTVSPIYFVGTGREGIFANVEHTTFRIPRFQIRAEARLDHSSADFFGSEERGTHRWELRYTLQLVTTF